MMEIFFITFGIMLIVITIMAVGYIFQKKKIKGSCGGISDLGLEKVCDCDEPCDKRKELMKRMQLEQEREKRENQNSIDIKVLDRDR